MQGVVDDGGFAVVRGKNCALVALVVVLPVVWTTTLSPPAAAVTLPTITHPQDDWAGAEIARYEGAGTQDEPLTNDPQPDLSAPPAPNGLDVSSHQGNVNWAAAAKGGAKFAYVKATEGTTYTNPYFPQQYRGSFAAGLIRGAYHFATPNTSGGAAQADYFVSHGGGWSQDDRTLPPAVDLEYNPYGQTCYAMSPAALAGWVHAFVNEVRTRTHRLPTIYTSTRWWAMCMGNNATFGSDPLWIARYNSVPGGLPPGWQTHAIWQYADAGSFPGDQDSFNGSMGQLLALAHG